MTISIADLAEIAEHMRRCDIATVEISGAMRLILRRAGGQQTMPCLSAPNRPEPIAQSVKSREPGIFIRRHPARADEEVLDGATVQHRKILGYVRAGSVVLAIRSPSEGRIQGLLEDGAVVGYGTQIACVIAAT